jgi:hypothetical protein
MLSNNMKGIHCFVIAVLRSHRVFGRFFNALGESGTRKILKPAISGNPSAASHALGIEGLSWAANEI